MVNEIEDTMQLTSSILNSSDVIFPVFASRDTVKLYGYWFIPFVDVLPGTYIIKKKSKPEAVDELIMGIAHLWPLLVILLLFVILLLE